MLNCGDGVLWVILLDLGFIWAALSLQSRPWCPLTALCWNAGFNNSFFSNLDVTIIYEQNSRRGRWGGLCHVLLKTMTVMLPNKICKYISGCRASLGTITHIVFKKYSFLKKKWSCGTTCPWCRVSCAFGENTLGAIDYESKTVDFDLRNCNAI